MRMVGWGLSLALLISLMVGSAGAQAETPGSGIFVTDTGSCRIWRMNDMTRAGWTSLDIQSPVCQSPAGETFPFYPGAIFVDGTGRIYLTDAFSPRIARMDDMAGTGWTTLSGFRGSTPYQFELPHGIFVDRAGRIYIADGVGNSRIVRVNDMTGAGLVTLGTQGSGVNQFIQPEGIFVDGAGRIYIADLGNDRVVRVDNMTGAGWVTLGSNRPAGIYVDGVGRIYVAETGFSCRVVRVNDMTGVGRVALGRVGYALNHVNVAMRVAVDSAGRIYGAHSANTRLGRIDNMTGAGWITESHQFKAPQGVFVR